MIMQQPPFAPRAAWFPHRCATKAGRTVQSVQVLLPEEDFPSPDGRHPLKIAIVRV